LLLEAANPVVESLLKEPYPTLTDAEFEAVLDELDQITLEVMGENPPVLSDYAVSREGIYEDHP
jgi:antitoxin ParD1/3/4